MNHAEGDRGLGPQGVKAQTAIPVAPSFCGDAKACFDQAQAQFKMGRKDEALAALRKACDANYKDSCYLLGGLELKAGNSAIAREAFTRACDAGDQESCYGLAATELSLKEKGGGLRMAKLCEARFAQACLYLAKVYEKDGEIEQANKLFRLACADGATQACGHSTPKRALSSE